MNPILALARPEIVALKPYSYAAWRTGLTRMHANEVPWRPAEDRTQAGLNRYPEPQPAALVDCLARLYGVSSECVLVTHGSDEAIDLLSRIYLRAGRDAILQCTPTFGMYQVAARIQGAAVIEVALDRRGDWALAADRVIDAWRDEIKLVYLCSPNNPTGNLLDAAAIGEICAALDGKAIVVLDEAYIEWSRAPSFAQRLTEFPCLAILRTLSKAHALAGARCGALLANPQMIALARRIIPPYSLAQPAIEAVMSALAPAQLEISQRRIDGLLQEKERLMRRLAELSNVERVWPSDANFVLIDVRDGDELMRRSLAGGFIVRDLRADPALPRSFRITVGSAEQNQGLLDSLERT
jgi:histidinol-phosphate aminotransferase